MRMHKFGSHLLRVVSPDGSVRYFATPGIASLRVFWIFRNFSTLGDRVLSERQSQFLRGICRSAIREVPKEDVDPVQIIGTLELSRVVWKSDSSPSSLSSAPPLPVPYADGKPQARGEFVVSVTAVSILLVLAVLVFAHTHRWRQLNALLTKHNDGSPFALDHGQIPNGYHDATPQSVGRIALERTSTADSRASAGAATMTSPGPRPSPRIAEKSPRLEAIEILQPAGPPQTHPVLADFSEIAKDNCVVLRAVVSPYGKVKTVKVLEGDGKLAHQAVDVVRSWRYPSRLTDADAESQIMFRFFAPDVVTVSFLDSAQSGRVPPMQGQASQIP